MTSGSPVVQLLDGVLVVTGEVNTDTVVGLRKQGEKLIRLASADLVVDLDGLVTALSFRGVSGRLASLAALSNLDDQLEGFGPEAVHPAH